MIKVEVTQSDIDHGTRQSNTSCPIAIALERITGERWSVGQSHCRSIRASHYEYLPYDAQQFVRRFDIGAPVAPFCFYTC
jgi:hypothetical protein